MSLEFNLSLGKKAKEGKINQDSFKGGVKKEQIQNEKLLNIFNAIDDGDGVLDEKEIEKFKQAVIKAAGDDNLSEKEAANILKANNIKDATKEDLFEFLNELNQASSNIKSSQVQTKGDKKTIFITYTDGTTETINPDKSKEIQAPNGKKTVKNPDNQTLYEEEVDAEGNVVKNYFENDKKTKSVMTAKGGSPVTTTYFDENGKPVRAEKQNGTTLEEYNYEEGSENPKLTKKTENAGLPAKEKVTEYTYNGDEVTETSTSNLKKSVIFRKDDEIIKSTVVENGKTTERTKTGNGYAETITDNSNLANVTTNIYDDKSNKLSSTKTENGKTYEVQYDGKGNTKVVIQNGESLEALAKKFGCTVEELKDINGGKIRGWAGDEIVVPGKLEAVDKRLQGRKSVDEAKSAYKVVAEEIKKEVEAVNARKAIDFTNKSYDTYEHLAKALFKNEGVQNPNKRQLQQRIEELKKNNPDLNDGELKGKKIHAPVSPEVYENIAAKAKKEKAEKTEVNDNKRIEKEQIKAEATQIVNDLKQAAKIGKSGRDAGLGTDDELLKKTIASIKSPEVLAEVNRQIAEIPGMVYGKRYEADNEHSAFETFLASEVSDSEVNDFVKTMVSNGALTSYEAQDAKARMAVRLIIDGGDGMGTDCDKIKEGIKVIDSSEVLKKVNDLISKHSSGWSLWTKSSSLQDYIKGEMWNSEIKYLDGLMAEQGALKGEDKTDASFKLLREAVEGAGTNIEYLEKALQTIQSPEDRKALEAKLDEYIKEKGIKKQYEGQSSLQAVMYDECDGFAGIGTEHDEIKKFNEMMIKQGAYTEKETVSLRAEQSALRAAEGDYESILAAVKDIKDKDTLVHVNDILKSKKLGSFDQLASNKLTENDALKIKGYMAINKLVPKEETVETSLKLIQSKDFDTIAIGLAAIRDEKTAVEVDKKLQESGTSLQEVMQKFNADKSKYAERAGMFKLFADFSILGNRDFFKNISNEYKENTDMSDNLYVKGKEQTPLSDAQKKEYGSVVGIFDDTITGAKEQMQSVRDKEGAVSEFVDDMRDRGELMGTTRNDIAERLKYDEESQRLYKLAAEGKLTRIDAQGNVQKVSFEEVFKERQGVDYNKAKIDEVKNQSVNMAAFSMVKDKMDDTLYKLNQGLNSDDPSSLQRGILSSIDTLSELSSQEIDLKALGYEISTVKDGETIDGSFGAKYISKDGKPIGLQELKQLAAKVKSEINTSYASTMGVEIPDGASDKEIEEFLDKSYKNKMEGFKDLYKEAFGKEAPDEMIGGYVTAQTYGKMVTGAVVTIAAAIAAPFTGGTSLSAALGVSAATGAAVSSGIGAAAASLVVNGLEASTDANGWTDSEIANNTSQALVDGALTALGFKVGQYADEVAKAGKILAQLKALGVEVSSDMASSTLAELIQNNGEITKDGFIQNMIFSLGGNASGRIFSNVTEKIAHVKNANPEANSVSVSESVSHKKTSSTTKPNAEGSIPDAVPPKSLTDDPNNSTKAAENDPKAQFVEDKVVPKDPLKSAEPQIKDLGDDVITENNASTKTQDVVAQTSPEVKQDKPGYFSRLKNKIKNAFSGGISVEQKQVLSELSDKINTSQSVDDFIEIKTILTDIPDGSQKNELLKQIDVKMEDLGLKINVKPVNTTQEAEKVFKLMIEDRQIGNASPEIGKPIFWNRGGEPWNYAMHKGGDKPQGTPWKIHLYADSPQEWANVAQVAMPYLNDNEISYKTIMDMDDFEALRNTVNDEGVHSQTGKSFTVYFESEEEFLKVAKDLEQRFKASGLKSSGTVENEVQIGDSGFISYRHEGAERGTIYKPDNVEDPYLKSKQTEHVSENDNVIVESKVNEETPADVDIASIASVKLSDSEIKTRMVEISESIKVAKTPNQIDKIEEMLDALPNSPQKKMLEAELDKLFDNLGISDIEKAERMHAKNVAKLKESLPNADERFVSDLADLIEWKSEISDKLMEIATKSGRFNYEIEQIANMATEDNIDDLLQLCKNKNLKFYWNSNDGRMVGNDFATVLKISKANPQYKTQIIDIASNSSRKQVEIYSFSELMKKYPDNVNDIAKLGMSNINIKVGYDVNGNQRTDIDNILKAINENPQYKNEIMDYMSVQRKADNDISDAVADLKFHIANLKMYASSQDAVKALATNPNLDAISIHALMDDYSKKPEAMKDILTLAKKGYDSESIKRFMTQIEKHPELKNIYTSESPKYTLIDKTPANTSADIIEKRFSIKEKLEASASKELAILQKTLGDDFYNKVRWEDIIPENATPAEIKEILSTLNSDSKFFARTSINENNYGKNIKWAHEMGIISDAAAFRIANGESFDDVIQNIAKDYRSYDVATTLDSNVNVNDRRLLSGQYRGKNDDGGATTPYNNNGGYEEYYNRFSTMLSNALETKKNRPKPYNDVELTNFIYCKRGDCMFHPPSETVGPAMKHVSERYNELSPLIDKVKNGSTLTSAERQIADEKISEIYYLMGNVMPWDRGSNGISDIFMRSMYESLGISQPALKQGVSLDLEAFCVDMDTYKANWKTYFEDEV